MNGGRDFLCFRSLKQTNNLQIKVAARRVVTFPHDNSGLNRPTGEDGAFENKAECASPSNRKSGFSDVSYGVENAEDGREICQPFSAHVQSEDFKLRIQLANDLAQAIAEAHPNDARQLLTGALIDLSAGTPSAAVFGTVREDAEWWASYATPAELSEVLRATLRHLRDRALHATMRKQLFMTLWRNFSPDEQSRFLTFAHGGKGRDH